MYHGRMVVKRAVLIFFGGWLFLFLFIFAMQFLMEAHVNNGTEISLFERVLYGISIFVRRVWWLLAPFTAAASLALSALLPAGHERK